MCITFPACTAFTTSLPDLQPYLLRYEVAGSWRAKFVNGTLWLKMLAMQRHWAERTSVLRVMLLAIERASESGPLPDFEFVYVHNDRDPTPPRGWPSGGSVVPLLTNGHIAGRSSIPVPDFSFAGWQTHTQPW